MPYIYLGKCKKKNIFLFLSILLLSIIFHFFYFSSYLYDFKKINNPNFFSLFFSFSFLGNFLFGGICLFILKKNLRTYSNNQFDDSTKEIKNTKKSNKSKKNLVIDLLYNDEGNNIYISMNYLLFSSLLELLTNFSSNSIVFDFMDIESKILYGGFELIFIKLFCKYVFKQNELYRHQIISMIFLLILLLIAIMNREYFLMQIVRNKYEFYETNFENYIKDTSNAKLNSGIIYYYYLIFIFIGLFSKSLSICYDKWLITEKFCEPYKLLFFKGLFGIVPALSIQLILYYFLGERGNIINEEINLRNLYKRLSFPISSFTLNKVINIPLVIVFFIIVSLYEIIIMITINNFKPEFIGLVNISSISISIISIQLFNTIINGKKNNKSLLILICNIQTLIFILILIPSLIICEFIILHFCGCDRNISSNIEKRAKIEAIPSLSLYEDNESENKDSRDESEESIKKSQESSF